jgi:ABC-type lipoprotein export system ATPase subunit
MADTAIDVRELVKSYGGAAPVHALRGVSLAVGRGEKVALLGKSGSGKSTLLNLVGGLDRPTSGAIEVWGRDLGRMRRNELARHRLDTVGMIFQSFNLIASRTALENVELPMLFAARATAERRATARQALEAVGLGHRLGHRPNELSGGEHQRVAIARALVNRPSLLLADEPTGNLDHQTADTVFAQILQLVHQTGLAALIATHNLDLADRMDRVLELRDGVVVQIG